MPGTDRLPAAANATMFFPVQGSDWNSAEQGLFTYKQAHPPGLQPLPRPSLPACNHQRKENLAASVESPPHSEAATENGELQGLEGSYFYHTTRMPKMGPGTP
ncbi:hypothetical protein KIL84_022745 [Mauremys mutica]|uniref:Uncharacterized protein n=1 Tax=Mauremys mutica TaxID=74926 RepID=A0A9D3WP20_9SAUR|nr:hypothetical protein KIL84_022745 [Mauremys mutica]